MASIPADRTELVGRAAEEALLEDLVAGLARREPSVLALVGEPGTGKSALLRTLADRARAADLRVLEARAAEHERDVPFSLAIDALDDAVDALGPQRLASLGEERLGLLAGVLPAIGSPAGEDVPPDPLRRLRALRALVELLAADRPLVLALDDVHWADDATVNLVDHLVRRPPRAPVLLALAVRPSSVVVRLREGLRAARAPAHELAVEPLDDASARALVAGVSDPRQRERIVAEARGNPLFLQELARVSPEVGDAVPPTVLAAVAVEVDALPPATRALLEGAAVAGDPFDPELAMAASGLETSAPAQLDRLVAADLVRPGAGRTFRFRHPLVRRAVYEGAPAGWRLEAHARAAAALVQRGASAVQRAHPVEHAAVPGDEDAIAVLAAAAQEALDTAPGAAAHWYGAALALLADADRERRLALLGPRAVALASAGRLHEARDAVLEALRLAPEGAGPERLTFEVACANIDGLLGQFERARRRLEEVLAGVPPDAPATVRAALELQLGLTLIAAGDGAGAVPHAAAALAGRGDDAAFAVQAHALLVLARLWAGEEEDVEAAVDRITADLRALSDAAFAARPEALWQIALIQLFAQRLPAALETAQRGLALAAVHRQRHLLAPVRTVACMALGGLGRLDEAIAHGEAAVEEARLLAVPWQLQWALVSLAVVLAERGDRAELRRVEQECRAIVAGMHDAMDRRNTLGNLAALAADEDPERAVRELLADGGRQLEGADPTWFTQLTSVLVRALAQLGRLDEAERWLERLDERAARLRIAPGFLRADTARAEVLLARGDGAEAARLALGAARTADARGEVVDAIVARTLAGRALAAAGREDEARTELRRVVEDAERIGSRRRDAAARELRRLGVRVAPALRPAEDAGGAALLDALSPREREIVALVAEGRSNKQIAAAVFLSDKSVERHLSNVFAKLRVRSRSEVAALVARAES